MLEVPHLHCVTSQFGATTTSASVSASVSASDTGYVAPGTLALCGDVRILLFGSGQLVERSLSSLHTQRYLAWTCGSSNGKRLLGCAAGPGSYHHLRLRAIRRDTFRTIALLRSRFSHLFDDINVTHIAPPSLKDGDV